MTDKHYHICTMAKRIASCQVRYEVKDCEDLRVNGECLISESRPFGLCSNFECQVTASLDDYKYQLDKALGETAKLKATNTQFRTLLLTPIQIDKMIEEGKIDHSGIDALINRQRSSWEVCDINTILYLMEMHQRFADAYYLYCQEKLGVINIPKFKDKVKKIESEKANQALKEAKEKEKEQEVKVKAPKSPYDKAVASYMKLGLPEDVAKKTVEAMGLKP